MDSLRISIESIAPVADSLRAVSDSLIAGADSVCSLTDSLLSVVVVPAPEPTPLRFAGEVLMQDFWRSNGMISLYLGTFLLFCLMVGESRSKGQSLLNFLLAFRHGREIFSTSTPDRIKRTALYLLTLLGYSVALLLWNGATGSYAQLGVMLSGVTLVLFLKTGCAYIYARTFFEQEGERMWYLSLLFSNLGGLICLFASLLVIFSPTEWIPWLYLLTGICLLSIIGLFLYVIFSGFFLPKRLFLHFISYLCTLEILPIALLIKHGEFLAKLAN